MRFSCLVEICVWVQWKIWLWSVDTGTSVWLFFFNAWAVGLTKEEDGGGFLR